MITKFGFTRKKKSCCTKVKKLGLSGLYPNVRLNCLVCQDFRFEDLVTLIAAQSKLTLWLTLLSCLK